MATPAVEKQKNIYAFLVGINKYEQKNINNLNGCLNDVANIEAYLDLYCKEDGPFSLRKKILRDEEATRRAIINGFRFFKKAKDGDICLFYFSGHGAQINAPPFFWKESDQLLEAIVCREDKGKDNLLIDKELSVLIHKATQKKSIHFLVIMDSCHSGFNTKSNQFTVRNVNCKFPAVAVNKLYGRSSYESFKTSRGEKRFNVPTGSHYKLSACSNHELAKERPLGDSNEIQGIFTFNLLETLHRNGNNLSYAHLLSKVRIKTKRLAANQSPQLETVALLPQERQRTFLGGAFSKEKINFQLSCKDGHWKINAGSAHGVKSNDLIILPDKQELNIEQVKAFESIIPTKGPLVMTIEQTEVLDVQIKFNSLKKLKVAFDTSIPESVRSIFKSQENFYTNFLRFHSKKQADYCIRIKAEDLLFTTIENEVALFSRVPGLNDSGIATFLKIIQQVAEWHRIVDLNNPDNNILSEYLKFDLLNVNDPYRHDTPDASKASSLDLNQPEFVFRYHFEEYPGGPWHPPAFRFNVENKHPRQAFWVSILYCGMGYSSDKQDGTFQSTVYDITNIFLEKERLPSGKVVEMKDKIDLTEIMEDSTNYFKVYESIELSILDDYFRQGNNEIKDILKVIVSTEELDTSVFQMQGIPIDVTDLENQRGDSRNIDIENNWQSFEFPITIVRPRDLGNFENRQSINFYGFTIKQNPYFSAKLILSTMEEFIRSTKQVTEEASSIMQKPSIFFGAGVVQVHSFTTGMGGTEGCSVLEFYRSNGIQNISKDNPLLITVDKEIKIKRGYQLCVCTYHAATRSYYLLQKMGRPRTFRITSLAPESPSLIQGLGDSIKLFFFQVKKTFELPLLPKSDLN